MCAPSHLRSSHLRSSYDILYLRICVASAHLHISDLYLDLYIFTFIFRSSYFETTSCLHTFGSSSRSHTVLSYHLQDFIMQLLSQLYNLIYLRLQNFISPLSGQPSSTIFSASSYIYIYLHISSYILIYLHTSSYISSNIFIYLHMSSYICIYLHVSSYIFMYLHISSYIFLYLRISSSVFMCFHVSSYIFIYVHMSAYLFICLHLS